MLGVAGLVMAVLASPDTTLILARTQRDMTGDGSLETLYVEASGPDIDDLEVEFVVTGGGRVLYSVAFLPISSESGYASRWSSEQRAEVLAGFDEWFFSEQKFRTPAAFLAYLSEGMAHHIDRIPAVIDRQNGSGPAVWGEIQRSGSPVFEYSPGGDGATAIAWSESAGRFFRLWECC